MQALSCLVRILRALVEWYMQTASHLLPEADPAEKQLAGQKESWGQLQSLKRAPSDAGGVKDGPGTILKTLHKKGISDRVTKTSFWPAGLLRCAWKQSMC